MHHLPKSFFYLQKDQWFGEDVLLQKIAKDVGTPCYVYSRASIETAYLRLHKALKELPHQICYAVKANSNIAILHLLGQLDSGCDIVSGGELTRALYATIPPKKIVFSGTGKTIDELTQALNANIVCFNIESFSELKKLNEIATALHKTAPIALRINPNITLDNHPYIATGHQDCKFGIAIPDAFAIYKAAHHMTGIKIIGIAFHLGSQITTLTPFITAIDKMLAIINELKTQGITIQNLNIGGGLAIAYNNEQVPTIEEYGQAITQKLKNTGLTIYCEPGRMLVAEAGVLLTKVEYIKQHANTAKFFAIVDAGMNDLLRPALYQARHKIIPIYPLHHKQESKEYDIVGPICESADVLGTAHKLALEENDLLMISNAGGYGFSMSSNYNSRPRAPEILINKDQYQIIRPREKITDLFNTEIIP